MMPCRRAQPSSTATGTTPRLRAGRVDYRVHRRGRRAGRLPPADVAGGTLRFRELVEECVGLLPDNGLAELADLAEHGEVGVDLDARADLGRGPRSFIVGGSVVR